MAAAFFNRRRAERFAQLLDQADGRSRRHSRSPLDEELADYVALGRMVSGRELTTQNRPDPDFRSSLRAMLVATAEREGIGVTAGKDQRRTVMGPVYLSAVAQTGAPSASRPGNRRPVVGSRRTRGAIIIGIAAGTLALSGMSMASGDAMPGDPLYGVKRSTESAQLALTGSDVDRGQAYLGFARNRILEASTLRDPGRVEATLGDMDNETTQGIRLLTGVALNQHDSTALNLIDDFVTTQRPLVTQLTGDLSGPARARAQQSVNLLDQVGRRVAGLRGSLLCGSAGTASDALGPKPPACPGASRAGQTSPGH
ncbi:DUF5667 domain-containing protein [Rugosimonospora africana]|uniref:DUF5667 domain-containing protein n=1 Tax=Rugosimonospora africana TaxID=556532 RepID=A0A8J3QMM2_9ACTN|nr:DUF5667 domain-containing protein [Rugosimonospora africana]GIH12308.1 hypothetical protein Raf01_04800 [Rugosimonospora africana]